MPRIEPVGVYPVPEAEQEAYLVELWVRGYNGKLDFARFSQLLYCFFAKNLETENQPNTFNRCEVDYAGGKNQ